MNKRHFIANRCRAPRGFTFVELVISMAIIALIAGMAFPLNELIAKRQKEKQLRIAQERIRNALDAYHTAALNNDIVHPSANLSFYPPDLKTLANGVDDARNLNGRKVYFLRRIPRNPFYKDRAVIDNADTWGLRSYESPPNNPQAGDDVYDVYVDSDVIGLNGVPYREW